MILKMYPEDPAMESVMYPQYVLIEIAYISIRFKYDLVTDGCQMKRGDPRGEKITAKLVFVEADLLEWDGFESDCVSWPPVSKRHGLAADIRTSSPGLGQALKIEPIPLLLPLKYPPFQRDNDFPVPPEPAHGVTRPLKAPELSGLRAGVAVAARRRHKQLQLFAITRSYGCNEDEQKGEQ
jgi:hypothetical protein